MDKSLSDKKKDDDADKKNNAIGSSAGSSAVPNYSQPSEQISGLGSAYRHELTKESWDASANARWDSSPQGRAAIRLFSRGGLGAAAFAAGNWYVSRGRGLYGYHSGLKFSEIDATKPLQYVAKSIDTFIGMPIKATVKAFGGSDDLARRFVHFRPTRDVGARSKGVSLGRESVNVTFDFFCSSIGDAAGRDIANLFDPHVKHDWKDEKGHIKYGEAAKSLGKTAWRYVSYNGGEDWAVAVPYAYYMGLQRKVINHFRPGFKLDAERGLNGGSFKINQQGKVIGNYNLEGLIDLQGRFTAYNVGTLMYREAYNYADRKIHGKEATLYGDRNDPAKKKQGVLDDIGDLFKWGARSVVKGTIFMTPAVPFFSIPRVSQSKHRGLFINPDTEAALSYQSPAGNYEMLHVHELRRSSRNFGYDANGNLPDIYLRKIDGSGMKFVNVGEALKEHPLSHGDFQAYAQKEGNRALNAVGAAQNYVRSHVNGIPMQYGIPISKRTTDAYVNAAFAYTPYMYAKAEAARLWDDGRMDAATERAIDGFVHADYREFRAGLSEIGNAIIGKKFADPKREAYALERIRRDYTPADSLTKEQGRIDRWQDLEKTMAEDINRLPLSWRERVVAAKEKDMAVDASAAKPTYAEQEEMRKALLELSPPTNSIH